MTLEELKDAIDDMVAEYGEEILTTEVMAVYDYGDHHHTQALVSFDQLDLVVPRESAYSCSGKALPDAEEREEVRDIREQIAYLTTQLRRARNLEYAATTVNEINSELAELRGRLDELEEDEDNAEHVIALM